MSTIKHKCVCGEGTINEDTDPTIENPFYFDCKLCDMILKLDKDGDYTVKKIVFKVGEVYNITSEKQLDLFLKVNHLNLGFYETNTHVNSNESYTITIDGIRK